MGLRWSKNEDRLLMSHAFSPKFGDRTKACRELSSILKRTEVSISSRYIRLGVLFSGLSHEDRRGEMKRDFFKRWTKESAYVLGFFCADGSFLRDKKKDGSIPRGITFEIHSKDKALLEKFKSAFNVGSPILNYVKRKTPISKLGFSCKEYVQDMGKIGLPLTNKTFRVKVPFVPHKYAPDFVRGYLDGDGCFYIDKRRKSLCSEFVGNYGFLCGIRRLISSSLRIYVPPPTVKVRSTFRLRLSGGKAVSLAQWIYGTESSMYLKRKKNVVDKVIK